MGSLTESVQIKRSFVPSRPPKDDLPISQVAGAAAPKIGLRRRFSSFSVSIQPLSSAAAAAACSAWAFRRSKSMSSVGELLPAAGGSLRRWWEWGWGWLLSRKPTFARDLEMNEEETAVLGFSGKGSWRHILHKLRRIVSGPADQLPTSHQGFRCDPFSYAQQHRHGHDGGNVSVY